MKLILIIADAARLDTLRTDLHALGAPGYSVFPVVEGGGRTGVHSGDRVHPGALAALVVVAEESEAARVFDQLVARRDAAGDRITRLFLLPVERQA
jgi:nitrogen regulatory protein PII